MEIIKRYTDKLRDTLRNEVTEHYDNEQRDINRRKRELMNSIEKLRNISAPNIRNSNRYKERFTTLHIMKNQLDMDQELLLKERNEALSLRKNSDHSQFKEAFNNAIMHGDIVKADDTLYTESIEDQLNMFDEEIKWLRKEQAHKLAMFDKSQSIEIRQLMSRLINVNATASEINTHKNNLINRHKKERREMIRIQNEEMTKLNRRKQNIVRNPEVINCTTMGKIYNPSSISLFSDKSSCIGHVDYRKSVMNGSVEAYSPWTSEKYILRKQNTYDNRGYLDRPNTGMCQNNVNCLVIHDPSHVNNDYYYGHNGTDASIQYGDMTAGYYYGDGHLPHERIKGNIRSFH